MLKVNDKKLVNKLVKSIDFACKFNTVKLPDAHITLEISDGLKNLLQALKIDATQNNLKTRIFDGKTLEVVYEPKNYKKTLLFALHLDTVGFNRKEWKTEPLSATIVGDHLYGRGVSDDKGPSIIVYEALKDAIKENKIKNKIILSFLTDEEGTNWTNSKKYVNECLVGDNFPDDAIVPDAEFPAILAEKGYISTRYSGTYNTTNNMQNYKVEKIYIWDDLNKVPQECNVTIKSRTRELFEDLKELLNTNLDSKGVVIKNNNEDLESYLMFIGIPAHGSLPHLGVSAITKAFNFLSKYKFDEQFEEFKTTYMKYLYDDVKGKNIGIYHKDDVMGETTNQTRRINYVRENNEVNFVIETETRIPKGIDTDLVVKNLTSFGFNSEIIKNEHYIFNNRLMKKDDYFTSLLKKSLNINTYGLVKWKPVSIGGGTYAKIIPNSVAYGSIIENSELNDKDPNFHGNGENISLKNIECSYNIYKYIIENY